MTDAQADLAAALIDSYRIERELGRGGMATVYLAHDLRHERQVALKVLQPELAASVGTDRFLREIRIASRLRHPHILPVHDSGGAGGTVWYTMPFVEGENLRQRILREGPLPIDQAVRIATQILGALGYAHAHDVIHRDIKPENILLEGDDAVVADFGVARAVSAAGGDRLTETGVALGTPAYMSPEQASGARELDGRSDLYAVGCVIYEMLAGTPPFVAVNAQQLIARHMVDTPPPIRSIRATLPDWLERSVMRALAKVPGDRYRSAAEFAEALAGPNERFTSGETSHVSPPSGSTSSSSAPPSSFSTSPPSPAPASESSPASSSSPNGAGISAAPSALAGPTQRLASLRASRTMVLVALGGVLVVGAAAYKWWPRAKVSMDAGLVAVVPFRVQGAAPSLRYLREGMIDLVAARLTGAGNARAIDPNSVMLAWRKAVNGDATDLPEGDALEIARGLGAGLLLLGGVVGTQEHITLNASLISSGERTRADASVQGSVDSLAHLVDRLVAQLVTEKTGVASGLDDFANTPLPALQNFLEARAAQRRGDYSGAVARYRQALEIDSTFALAGVNLAGAAGWAVAPGAGRYGLQRAWAGRNRLNQRDRALVAATVGPSYPGTSTMQEHVTAWEHAVDVAPDQPDRWFELGDLYFHEAPYLQIDSTKRRAADAFRRSASIDSGASSIGHLLELAVREHDSATVAKLGALYLRRDTKGELLDFYRWRIAAGTRDADGLAKLRARMPSMRLESLWRIMNYAVLDGEHLDDADAAAAAIRANASRSSDWQRSKTYLHAFGLNRGHPSVAMGDTARADELEYGAHAALYERVLDALYGGADSVSARAGARELMQLADRTRTDADDPEGVARRDRCVATLWAMHEGSLGGVPQAIERIRRGTRSETPETATSMTLCAALLEAKYTADTRAPNARVALDRLDSLMWSGPGGQRNGPPVAFSLSPAYARSLVGISPVGFEDFANLEVAKLREREGNLPAALSAVRRRGYAYHLTDYLAAHLREQGRLAALTGDRDGAVRAYRHYLALRSNPEPGLKEEAEQVRRELAKLGEAR